MMTLKPNEIYLTKSSSVTLLKVYVLVIKKEQDDDKAYIYGVYSTKEKAVEEAHNLPPCFVHISEFEVDGGNAMMNLFLS